MRYDYLHAFHACQQIAHLTKSNKSIFLRSIDHPEIGSQYTQHTAPTTVARFAPSGFYVASGDASGCVRVWDCQGEGATKGYDVADARQPSLKEAKNSSTDPKGRRVPYHCRPYQRHRVGWRLATPYSSWQWQGALRALHYRRQRQLCWRNIRTQLPDQFCVDKTTATFEGSYW